MKKYFLVLSLLVIYTSSCAQQFGNVQEPISSTEVEAREFKEATEITEPHEKTTGERNSELQISIWELTFRPSMCGGAWR